MPSVDIQENSSFDAALRRFKRSCEKAGIPSKLRQDRYEKPTAKRKRKKAAAIKRHLKKLQKEREALERERTR